MSNCFRAVLALMALFGTSQLGAQTINVTSYGAIGDMKTSTTATCTAGSPAVSVSSTFFMAGDVGKLIELSGCGISGAMLWTSIAGVADGMHATLATAASTSVAASTIDVGTDNSLTLQAALDAAANMSGGSVYAPAGKYMYQTTLLVGSSVHLYGDGIGSTVLRQVGVTNPCKNVLGATVCAGVAMAGVDHASVSYLTVDQTTLYPGYGNGIVMVPSGSNFQGTVTTDSQVDHCEVIKNYNSTYDIWNLRGVNNKILYNYVNGGITGNSPGTQEGIEVFGGSGVLVQGNTVINVGNNCYNIATGGGNAAGSQTALSDIRVKDNYASVCQVGYIIQAGNDTFTQQPMTNISLENNDVAQAWVKGISMTTVAGSVMTGISITENRVRNSPIGIFVSGDSSQSTVWSSVSISGNLVQGSSNGGMDLVRLNNAVIQGNNVVSSVNFGIYLYYTNNLQVLDNQITTTQTYGMIASFATLTTINRNTFWNWNQAGTARYPAISLGNVNTAAIGYNNFYISGLEGYAVSGSTNVSGVTLLDTNNILYANTLKPPYSVNTPLGETYPAVTIESNSSQTTYGSTSSANTQGINIINSSNTPGRPFGIQFGGAQSDVFGGIYGNMTVSTNDTQGTIDVALRTLPTSPTFTRVAQFSTNGVSALHFSGAGTAPVIGSGFGTSPTIVGQDTGGRVTVGSGGASTGIITFGMTWPNPPACVANDETTILTVSAIATTASVTLTSSTPWNAGDKLTWICMGF